MTLEVLDAAAVARVLGVDESAAVVREVLDATGGWSGAVALAADHLAADPTWAVSPRAVLGPLVLAATRAEPALPVLARLPLLDDHIIALTGAGPLVVPTRRQGAWTTLEPAVADVARTSDPLDQELLLTVCRHLHGLGETATATQLVRDEGDERTVRAFVRDLHWTDLARLSPARLRELVADVGPRSPTLLLVGARAVELHDRPLRATWLQQAAEQELDPVLRRAVDAEAARDLYRSGDATGGAAAARAVLDACDPDELLTRGRAHATLAMTHAYLASEESLGQAVQHFDQAAELFRRCGERDWRADVLARLGYTALYMGGHPARGAEAMAEALSLLPVGDATRSYWLANHADVLSVLGRDLEAEASLREALEIGERQHDEMSIGMAWWTRSWLAARRGDVAATKAAVAEVEHHRGTWLGGGQEAELLASSAEHLALLGDSAGFADLQGRADALAHETGFVQPARSSRATWDCFHGDAAQGLEAWDALEAEGEAVVACYRPQRLLLRAVAHRRLGDAAQARRLASEAYDAAARLGVPDLPTRHLRPLVSALTDLVDDTVPAVVLRLLGGFSLSVDGEDRTPQPGHASTLIKVLALVPTVTTGQLLDELWPEVDEGTGRARLRNLVNRIKERSGPVVQRNGSALRLDPEIAVDATSFEAAATAALAASPEHRVGLARTALALYSGELLPGDHYDDRVIAARARLQRRMVSLVDVTAEAAVQRGDLDEAARLLDLAIGAEPLDELRVLSLCDVLVRLGRPSQATAVARRCAGQLAELGLEPGPELSRAAR